MEYRYIILIKLEFSRHIFEKYSNIKFHENPSSASRVVPCGRTDRQVMTKVIVVFRNLANVPGKVVKYRCGPCSRGIKTRLTSHMRLVLSCPVSDNMQVVRRHTRLNVNGVLNVLINEDSLFLFIYLFIFSCGAAAQRGPWPPNV